MQLGLEPSNSEYCSPIWVINRPKFPFWASSVSSRFPNKLDGDGFLVIKFPPQFITAILPQTSSSNAYVMHFTEPTVKCSLLSVVRMTLTGKGDFSLEILTCIRSDNIAIGCHNYYDLQPITVMDLVTTLHCKIYSFSLTHTYKCINPFTGADAVRHH